MTFRRTTSDMGRAALAAIVLSVAHVATASYCPGGQYCGYSW